MDENSLFISAPADFTQTRPQPYIQPQSQPQSQPQQEFCVPQPPTLQAQNPTSNVINQSVCQNLGQNTTQNVTNSAFNQNPTSNVINQSVSQNLGQNTTQNVTNSAFNQNPTSNVVFPQGAGQEFLTQNPPPTTETSNFSNRTYKDRLVQAINQTKLLTLQEIAAIEQHLQSFSPPNPPMQNRTQNVGFSQVHNSQTQAPTSTPNSDVSQLGSLYTNNGNSFDSSANVGNNVDLTPELSPDNPARSELKAYIAQNCSHLEPAEIGKILELVRSLESQAVAAFQKKSLEECNRRATDKLSTDSFSSKPSAVRSSHTFTRAEIANMSVQEFRAKKAEIYEQCAKGLVK